MTDWLHCNLCFYRPGDERNLQVSLTNCGHVYCEECLKRGTNNNRCEMCGGSPCSSIKLTAKMKPDVEIFFQDPVDIMKKQQKQLIQVMDFQKSHRNRLTAHIKEQLKKQHEILRNNPRQDSNFNRAIEREILILKEENNHLKKLIQSMKHSPGNRPSPQYARRSPRSQHLQQGHSVSPSGSGSPAQMPHGATQSVVVSRKSPYRSYSSQPTTPCMPGVPNAPQGPKRITIRTPPSGGKIGVIPGREQVSTTQTAQILLGFTPGFSQQARTPGNMSAAQPSSPMQTDSPSGHSLKNIRVRDGMHGVPGMTSGQRTPTSQDMNRRPIQISPSWAS